MSNPKRRILAIGRGMNPVIIKYFARLTGKECPRICLLPTASGDDPKWIKVWHELAAKIGFESHDLPLFISSFTQQESFEEVLLSMDAIYVGGGNTVNMLAIWKAQGIDTILKQAYEKGILLGGGSAGGICWFEGGLTDSRPKELTAMSALGWLKGSFAPHYLSEPDRRVYYHRYIQEGELSGGLAADDTVGLLFEDEELVRAVGSIQDAKAFRVTMSNGEISEEPLEVDYVAGT